MIQPRNADETKYVFNLAAFLIRAKAQVDGGDKPGSVRFTDAYRSLKTWGDARYPRENEGFEEWAQMLAQEDPRSDRLVAFLAEQDTRMKQPEPIAQPAAQAPENKGKEIGGKTGEDIPPISLTTLANVVQRQSDRKSDKPTLPGSRPAPVVPPLPDRPSPVLYGNETTRTRDARRRKRKATENGKETP